MAEKKKVVLVCGTFQAEPGGSGIWLTCENVRTVDLLEALEPEDVVKHFGAKALPKTAGKAQILQAELRRIHEILLREGGRISCVGGELNTDDIEEALNRAGIST